MWFLHLASYRIDDANRRLAYAEVHRILGSGPHTWLDAFQVRVASADSPVARAVIEYMRQVPAGQPARYWGRPLGNLSVDEAYIYPLPAPVPA